MGNDTWSGCELLFNTDSINLIHCHGGSGAQQIDVSAYTSNSQKLPPWR